MKLVAVTPCSDEVKGEIVIYQIGEEFEIEDKKGQSLIDIKAAAKPTSEEAKLAKISGAAVNPDPTFAV